MALFNKDNPNIRFISESDSVEVFDKYRNEWRHWTGTGLIVLPSIITVRNAALDGKTVTCVISGVTYTTTFVSGVATFKVYEEGTATITCGDWKTTAEVSSDSKIDTSLTEPVVITVTNSALNGKSATCVISGVTYTATFSNNKAVFKMTTTGTANITCGDWKGSISIPGPGSYSLSLIQPAYINVTGTNLNGKAVTCKVGSESYTSTFTSSKASFKVYTAGTVTLTSDGVTKTVSVSLGGTYNVEMVKIIDVVLWNGSAAQNGASAISNGTIDTLSFSNISALSGKSLVIKPKNAYSSGCVSIEAYKDSTFKGYTYVSSSIATSNETKGYNTTKSAWSAGVEYIIPCSKIKGITESNKINIKFRDCAKSTYPALSTVFSYIAIR